MMQPRVFLLIALAWFSLAAAAPATAAADFGISQYRITLRAQPVNLLDEPGRCAAMPDCAARLKSAAASLGIAPESPAGAAKTFATGVRKAAMTRLTFTAPAGYVFCSAAADFARTAATFPAIAVSADVSQGWITVEIHAGADAAATPWSGAILNIATVRPQRLKTYASICSIPRKSERYACEGSSCRGVVTFSR